MIFSLPQHPMHFVLMHNKALTDQRAGKDFVNALIHLLEHPEDTAHEPLSQLLANKTVLLQAPAYIDESEPYNGINFRLNILDMPNWRPSVSAMGEKLHLGGYPMHVKTTYLHIHIRNNLVDKKYIGDQVSIEWFSRAYHADGHLTSIFVPRQDDGTRDEFIKDSVEAMIREWLAALEAAAQVVEA